MLVSYYDITWEHGRYNAGVQFMKFALLYIIAHNFSHLHYMFTACVFYAIYIPIPTTYLYDIMGSNDVVFDLIKMPTHQLTTCYQHNPHIIMV